MAKFWLPSHRASRIVGARLLKAHRSGEILVGRDHELACVDACCTRFLSPNLRRLMGRLWLEHGLHLVLKAREADQTAYSEAEDRYEAEMLRALSA